MRKENLELYEFYSLGMGEPIPISAGQMLGLGDLLEVVTGYFPEGSDNIEEEDVIKVAIIGKPNVGKSSLVNNILGSGAMIWPFWKTGPFLIPGMIWVISWQSTCPMASSVRISFIKTRSLSREPSLVMFFIEYNGNPRKNQPLCQRNNNGIISL